MPKCKKCSNNFPCHIWIDGKERNLQNRSYCLECSPFGQHNTKRIHIETKNEDAKHCDCGRLCKVGNRCFVCYQKEKVKRVRIKVHKLVGTACWRCGFDLGMDGVGVLDFHHVNPENKNFSLYVRNMCNRAWKVVLPEIKKCTLLCCRCHRMFELGLISQAEIKELYEKEWTKRNSKRNSKNT